MKVIVTGGSGFIGSHLCRRLITEGHEVEIFDIRGDIPMHRDVSESDILCENFTDFDAVFHLAANTSVRESVEHPDGVMANNVGGTVNMLMFCKQNGIKDFVYISSAAVYGDSGALYIEEECPIKPLSPYGVSKYTGEMMCDFYGREYGMNIATLRPFNVYGPGQNPNSEYAAAIPKFITRVIQRISPIIYGDGEQTRDFIYVDDVVDAMLLARGRIGTFNIGTGIGTSVNKLAAMIMSMGNICGMPIYEPKRQGDIKNSVSDPFFTSKVLEFRAKTKLEEGLKKTYGWYAANMSRRDRHQ